MPLLARFGLRALAATILVAAGARCGPAADAAPLAKDLTLAIRFDPGPTYGGVRWMPLPFKTGLLSPDAAAVEARLVAFDPEGRQMPVVAPPRWKPSDPGMLEVTTALAGKPDQVRIRVKRAGESTLEISALGASRVFRVKAVERAQGTLQVEVST
jgi:hypothetical protein